MVMPICELWERAPETPASVTFTEPAAAVAVAVKVMVNGEPGLDCRLGGDDVIPFGNPATEKVTAELNPFSPLMVTEIDAVPPPAMVTLFEERVRVKSGDAGGGFPPPEFPPPHAAIMSEVQNRTGKRNHRMKAGAATR
jgi:hypothetical protein